MVINRSPSNQAELLKRCQQIEGWSFGQLAKELNWKIPDKPTQRKGWIGQAIETILGSTAGQSAQPDFHQLGIELKTIPLNHLGKPAESTFITSIPLLTIHQETWETSTCYAKIKKVLWLPVEGDKTIPFVQRRMGKALLWEPSSHQKTTLEHDWKELTFLINTGHVAEITAHMGQYLQIRPKAANSKSLCYCLDEQGNQIPTLPRGFYFRSLFTSSIINSK